MCHVAAWLLNGVAQPAHGEVFWKWAKRAEEKITGITISRCHSYEINAPHKFLCNNTKCAQVYARHTKKGVDVDR
jgi:hypothetical protein